MFFPVFALAVGITVVRLLTLLALGQVVSLLAAVEAPKDGDPRDFVGEGRLPRLAGLLLLILLLLAKVVAGFRVAVRVGVGGGVVVVVARGGAVVWL